MSKVLVERELLESALKTIHGLAPGRFTVEEELRAAVTAQPAEAEGVDAAYFEIWARSIEHPVIGWLGTNSFRRGDAPETYGDPYVQGAWVVYQRLSAGLSAVTAERDRLSANIERLTASPADHRYWEGSYRDEAASNDQLRAEIEALKQKVKG